MRNDIVDMKELVDRGIDDKELIIELLEDFIKDFVEKRNQLIKELEQKNYERVKDITHGLKGSAGNLSIKSMHTCFMLIEYLANNNEDELILDVLKDVDNQFSEVKEYFSKMKK